MLRQAARSWQSHHIITGCQVAPAAQGRARDAAHTPAHACVQTALDTALGTLCSLNPWTALRVVSSAEFHLRGCGGWRSPQEKRSQSVPLCCGCHCPYTGCLSVMSASTGNYCQRCSTSMGMSCTAPTLQLTYCLFIQSIGTWWPF